MQVLELRNNIIEIYELRAGKNENKQNNEFYTIVVYLTSASMCNLIVNKSRRKHGVIVSDIFDSNLCSRIYVNENLTQQKFKLYLQARKQGKDNGWKSVFTSFGSILAKKTQNAMTVHITSANDLQLIFWNAHNDIIFIIMLINFAFLDFIFM